MREAEQFTRIALSVLLVFSGLYGCSIPTVPPMHEQRQLIEQANLSSSDRFAVVSRHDQGDLDTPLVLAAHMLPEIVRLTEENLGVDAAALELEGARWSGELKRARDATGMFTATSFENFFRESGYDGYVLVTLFLMKRSDVFVPGEQEAANYYTYSPVFHVVSLPKEGEKVTLAILGIGQGARIVCELDWVTVRVEEPRPMETRRPGSYKDVQACADQIVARYKAGLGELLLN